MAATVTRSRDPCCASGQASPLQTRLASTPTDSVHKPIGRRRLDWQTSAGGVSSICPDRLHNIGYGFDDPAEKRI